LPGGFKLTDVFLLAESETIGVGAFIALLPLGSLANGPKIDHFSHVVILIEVTGYVSAQRSGSDEHVSQMCRHVGGISSFRISLSVSTSSQYCDAYSGNSSIHG
jgi:hypothetical protein